MMKLEATNPGDREARLEQVLAEYLHAAEAGQPLDQQQMLEEHPELAEELHSFFANRKAPERIAEPLKGSAYDSTIVVEQASSLSSNARERHAGSLPHEKVRYFGDYELLEELGRGGMGVVYKARQTTLNRLVALKMILSGQLASADDVQRFKQEAEAAANLDHPHIAPIYETGEHQGQHYFSMKLIEGRSLRDALPQLQNDIRNGVTLLSQVARAVHHAHQRGVLHRDLKPANVLLDQDGTPYVTDFGLARRVEGGSDVTKTGAIVGTPSYMSPEQATGEKELTTAVDVYSLGAMLYELLTGCPPFRGATPTETVLQLLATEPARPSTICRHVDRDLETICLKCLEKEPPRRYESSAALADDLRRWLAGEPIVARPSSLSDRARKWVKRKPAMAGLLAVSVLAGLLFVAFITRLFDSSRLQTQFTEATRQKAAADRERQNVEREHAEAMRQSELAERRKQSFLYAANVNLIQQAWEVGEMGRMRRLLDEQRPAEDQPDLRGFEWYYLWQRAHTERQVLKGHTGVLRSVAFAADGTWLVSGDGSNDNRQPGEVLRWDIATGKPRSLFRQQTATPVGAFMGISALAVSPDGQHVAVSDNERVRILDSTTGDERHALPVQRDFVKALAFSPDSQLLASGTLDGKVKFWNSTSGEELGTIDALQSGITSLAFSPDGERLAVAGGGAREPTFVQETSGKIAVWDVRTRQSVWRLEKAGPMISCVAFSPDGDRLATADLHFVNVLDAANGKTINSEHGQTDRQSRVCCVAFSPDGKQLASCGDASIVRLWDGATGKSIGSLNGHETSRVTCLSFAADGALASGGDDTTVRLWEPSVSPERSQLGPLTWAVQDTVFSRDSRTLAVAEYTSVTLFASDTGQPRQTIPVNHWCFGMDLSPDGELLATGGNRGAEGQEPGIVKVWDTTTGNELASLDPHVKSVKRVQFSADGRHLLAAGWGRSAEESRVALWNLADFAELGTWENCPAAALAHDSRTLALMRTDGIVLWDIAAGRRQNQLVGSDTMQQEFATAGRWLEFSPDDQSLVSVGDERTAIVWDIATLSRRTTLSGHANVERTLYSPDGQTLATMSRTEIRLWDCERYEERHTLPVGNCQFLFTPDSATLITSLGGPTLWHVATGQLLLKLSGYGLPVNCLAISPDGTQLAEAGGWRDENEGVYIWRISTATR